MHDYTLSEYKPLSPVHFYLHGINDGDKFTITLTEYDVRMLQVLIKRGTLIIDEGAYVEDMLGEKIQFRPDGFIDNEPCGMNSSSVLARELLISIDPADE